MKNQLRPALTMLALLSVLTGILYPLLITGIGASVFPGQAGGSLIVSDNALIGSELIGQQFTDPKYFWSRPSATADHPYNAMASGGSNLGPLNPALMDAVKERVSNLRAADPGNPARVPVDLVTASASGLDPHISVAAANYQLARVARVRALKNEQIAALVRDHTEGRLMGLLGEPRVNVLKLNLALDGVGP